MKILLFFAFLEIRDDFYMGVITFYSTFVKKFSYENFRTFCFILRFFALCKISHP